MTTKKHNKMEAKKNTMKKEANLNLMAYVVLSLLHQVLLNLS